MSAPTYRVVAIALPKSGTTSLAVMLKLLGYHVAGPNPELQRGDSEGLDAAFAKHEGFQDYPWCFEWERWRERDDVRFVVLERDPERWWASFLASYGFEGTRYLSHPYMQLDKSADNRDAFLALHRDYYARARAFADAHPDRVLWSSIKELDWPELCALLDTEPPRDALGRPIPKPHAHKEHHRERDTLRYRAKVAARSLARHTLLPAVGERRWHRFITFLRANGLYR